MHSSTSGVDIQPGVPQASIDLATLISLLAQAVPPHPSPNRDPNDPNPYLRPALSFDSQTQRLKIATPAILRRLYQNPAFKAAFKPENRGFIQNLTLPSFGNRAWIGGRLVEGNAVQLPRALNPLIAAIDEAIAQALPQDTPLSSFLLDRPEQQLAQLAKSAKTVFKNQTQTANLVPLAFQTATQRKLPSDSRRVAKVISAQERVESDYFERMSSSIADCLKQRDADEDEIDSALASLHQEKQREESQLNRFLKFLENEALSRVRLSITFQIMDAIASNATTIHQPRYQLLTEYVQRVLRLFKLAQEQSYSVDLTATFGSAVEFDWADYLKQSTFYSCLSVLPESRTQIFEEKVRIEKGNNVVREVSYRFRINGKNPESRQSAFVARLENIEEILLKSEELPGTTLRRALAQLVFLLIVVPQSPEESFSPENIHQSVLQIIQQFNQGGKDAIKTALDCLKQREGSMTKIATALIDILRQKSQNIIAEVQDYSSQVFICVKRDIVNWVRLEGAEPGTRDLLIGGSNQTQEKADWFNNIEICDRPQVPNILFSIQVNTALSEYDLVTQNEDRKVQFKRLLNSKILQICWVPYSVGKTPRNQYFYRQCIGTRYAVGLSFSTLVEVEYETQNLLYSDKGNRDLSKQIHAAMVSAFIVLTYCCLWRIFQKIKHESLGQYEFTTLMLRLQEKGKENSQKTGDNYIYAAAQAIESALAEDISIRMQGLVLNKVDNWKKQGTFEALVSAFPLAISTPTSPFIPKIGLISYATRPCDENFPASEEDNNNILRAQSYIATAIEQPFLGYELKRGRVRSDILYSAEQYRTQRLVQEEISYLQSQGCQHIILLSHAYRGLRMNRAADYNVPLIPKEFLEDIERTFPNLTIYTLLRDVFPATRLERRQPNEAAFEILRAVDHTNF
uniref:Uncharacterized protein n=1 Tax=Desertifilum tharense IPPAS B-1220 TaxID=1781255 RepID=A0ACD5GWK8_9CYAN